MSIVFIVLGAWFITALLMVFSLVAAARRPTAHSETSSLDTPMVHSQPRALRRKPGNSDRSAFSANARQEAT
jgi:hypothetical protein